MATTMMLRVSERAHEGFKRKAERRGETVDSVASAALRAVSIDRLGDWLGNVGPAGTKPRLSSRDMAGLSVSTLRSSVIDVSVTRLA